MVHDAISGCEHQEPELTRGQQVVGPGLDLVQLHGETGADNTTLVQAAIQGHDDFPGTVVIDNLELINVPCKRAHTPSTHTKREGGSSGGE